MKTSQRKAFLDKLKTDLEDVEAEVARLFSQREVFKRLACVFTTNPALNAAWTQLHTFIFSGYTAQACMRLRRLMDQAHHKDTVSLANIVRRLCDQPDIITRDEYVRAFTSDIKVTLAGCHDSEALGRFRSAVSHEREREANELFDRFAGQGGSLLNPQKIRDLYEPTRRKWEEVHSYVSKRLAHYDRAKPADATWGDLDDVIDAVGKLYREISSLVNGTQEKPEDLWGTWQGAPWEPLLEAPWLTRCEPC